MTEKPREEQTHGVRAAQSDRTVRQDLVGLGGFMLLCLVISALGGYATSTSVGTWYQTLDKPTFSPPDWVFAPVWTVLYLLMAIAAWRIWRGPQCPERARALRIFGLQLALNLAWSFLFFGLRDIGLALVEIIILICAIATTVILFARINRAAALMLLPYLLWVVFASVLNGSLWLLN